MKQTKTVNNWPLNSLHQMEEIHSIKCRVLHPDSKHQPPDQYTSCLQLEKRSNIKKCKQRPQESRLRLRQTKRDTGPSNNQRKEPINQAKWQAHVHKQRNQPWKSSGAAYGGLPQNVSNLLPKLNSLLNPKSAILIFISWSRRRFSA